MQKTSKSLAAIALLALTSCVHRDVIVLKNSQTGQAVTCQSNTGSGLFPIAEAMSDNASTRDCAEGYEAAGFQRIILPAN